MTMSADDLGGIKVEDEQFIFEYKKNVISEFQEYFLEYELTSKTRLEYIESCFNEIYSAEILKMIVYSEEWKSSGYKKSNLNFILTHPHQGSSEEERRDIFQKARSRHQSLKNEGNTIFDYCRNNIDFLKNYFEDNEWYPVIEKLLRLHNIFLEDFNNDQSHKRFSEDEYFLHFLYKEFPICYKAFVKAMESGVIHQKGDQFDFQCRYKISISRFFGDTNYTAWTQLAKYITFQGDDVNPDNIKSKAKSSTDPDWELAKYIE